MENKKSKRKKPSYSLLNNIMFYMKDTFKHNKSLVFYGLLKIITIVFIPLTAIYMPKIVVEDLSLKVPIDKLIIDVGNFVLIIILLNLISGYLEERINWGGAKNRMMYSFYYDKKMLDIDFEKLDDPDFKMVEHKAQKNALESNESALEAIYKVLITFIADFLGIFIYGNLILNLSPYLILIIALTTIISYLAMVYSRNYENNHKDKWILIDKKIQYINDKAGEFQYGKDIRLYNMENWFKKMFSIFMNKRKFFRIKAAKRWIMSSILEGIMILLRDGLCYFYIVYEVVNGYLTVDNFILYFGAISGFSLWITGVLSEFNELNRMSLSICDYRDFINFKDDSNRGKGIKLPNEDELPLKVEFKNVSYLYSNAKEYTIKDFNLKVNAGEKIAIVGVNGAGKTTLMKLLSGLYKPTKGEILVNGHNIQEYNRDEYFLLISAIFQDINILPCSIAENIVQFDKDKIDNEKLIKSLKLSGLYKEVQSLKDGINTRLVKSVYDDAIDLSGGQNQKLMLARALYKNAPILILDEPTAALDPIAENELYMKYAELTKGKTSFFISHRLSSTRFCDRIIFLENGFIKEIGTHDELMNLKGSYAKMFEVQSHYYKENLEGDRNEEISRC